MTFTMTFSTTLTPAPGHMTIVLLVICGLLMSSCQAASCSRDEVADCLPDHITNVKSLSMLKCSLSGKACIEALQRTCPGHLSIGQVATYKDYSCSALGISDYAAVESCYSSASTSQATSFNARLEQCNADLQLKFQTDVCSAYKAYDVCIELAYSQLCSGSTGAVRFWDKWGDLLEAYYCFSGAASLPHMTKLMMVAWVGVLSYIFI